MKTTQLKTILEFIKEKEKNFDFNDYIENYINIDDFKKLELDEVVDYIRDLDDDGDLTQTDVIYYATAMDYLKENDPSLSISMELANDMGFETKNINSELLASILKTDNNKDDFNDFIDDFNDFIDEMD